MHAALESTTNTTFVKPYYFNSQISNLKSNCYAVEVIVAMLTAAITALTTTRCMGYGPIYG